MHSVMWEPDSNCLRVQIYFITGEWLFVWQRPSSLRIDQLDRAQDDADVITYPKIIHFGIRPAQLSYAGDAT